VQPGDELGALLLGQELLEDSAFFSAFFAATSRSSDDGSWTGGLPISLLSSLSLRSISSGSGWFLLAPPAISLSRLADRFSCRVGSSAGRRESPLVRTGGTNSSALTKRPDWL
jgi:hypothetical protein